MPEPPGNVLAGVPVAPIWGVSKADGTASMEAKPSPPAAPVPPLPMEGDVSRGALAGRVFPGAGDWELKRTQSVRCVGRVNPLMVEAGISDAVGDSTGFVRGGRPPPLTLLPRPRRSLPSSAELTAPQI